MDVSYLGIQLLNSLVLAMLLFMLAVGLSVVFGLLDVLNLAHATFYMFGAYLAMQFTRWNAEFWSWLDVSVAPHGFWLSLILVPPAITAAGVVFYEVLLKRVRGNHMIQALITFGLLFVGYDLVRIIWGNDFHQVTQPPLLDGTVTLFGQVYPVYRLFVILVGIGTLAVLYVGLERTRFGAIVRAGVDDRETIAMLGINVDRAFFITFCIGTFLAGLAGVVAAPFLSRVEPGMDVQILISTLIVVVIGGPGSLKGAMLGALVIGIAETFGPVLIPELSAFMIYLVMAIVLLIRPQGLLPVRGAH